MSSTTGTATRTVDAEQWRWLVDALKAHASIDYAYRRAVEFAELFDVKIEVLEVRVVVGVVDLHERNAAL